MASNRYQDFNTFESMFMAHGHQMWQLQIQKSAYRERMDQRIDEYMSRLRQQLFGSGNAWGADVPSYTIAAFENLQHIVEIQATVQLSDLRTQQDAYMWTGIKDAVLARKESRLEKKCKNNQYECKHMVNVKDTDCVVATEHNHPTEVEGSSCVFEENNIQRDNSEQDDTTAQDNEFNDDPNADSKDNGGVSTIEENQSDKIKQGKKIAQESMEDNEFNNDRIVTVQEDKFLEFPQRENNWVSNRYALNDLFVPCPSIVCFQSVSEGSSSTIDTLESMNRDKVCRHLKEVKDELDLTLVKPPDLLTSQRSSVNEQINKYAYYLLEFELPVQVGWTDVDSIQIMKQRTNEAFDLRIIEQNNPIWLLYELRFGFPD